MALQPRQTLFYKQRISLYRVRRTGANQYDPVIPDGATPDVADLPTMYESTPEYDDVSMTGRFKRPNQMNADVFHVEVNSGVVDGMYLQMTVGPDHLVGRWWYVVGNPRSFDYRSNAEEFFAVRVPDPVSANGV